MEKQEGALNTGPGLFLCRGNRFWINLGWGWGSSHEAEDLIEGRRENGGSMVGVEESIFVFTFPSICEGPHIATGLGPLSQTALKMVGFRESKEAGEFE